MIKRLYNIRQAQFEDYLNFQSDDDFERINYLSGSYDGPGTPSPDAKVSPGNREQMWKQIMDAERTGRPEVQSLSELINQIKTDEDRELEELKQEFGDDLHWVMTSFVNSQPTMEDNDKSRDFADAIWPKISKLMEFLELTETKTETEQVIKRIIEIAAPAFEFVKKGIEDGTIELDSDFKWG